MGLMASHWRFGLPEKMRAQGFRVCGSALRRAHDNRLNCNDFPEPRIYLAYTGSSAIHKVDSFPAKFSTQLLFWSQHDLGLGFAAWCDEVEIGGEKGILLTDTSIQLKAGRALRATSSTAGTTPWNTASPAVSGLVRIGYPSSTPSRVV